MLESQAVVASSDGQVDVAANDRVAVNRGFEERMLLALRRIIRAVDLRSRQLSTTYGITAPQLVCLMALAEREPLSVSAIARQVHLSASTVIGILDRLATKDLVVRQRDEVDRRLVYARLTDQGRQVVADHPSPLSDRLATAMDLLEEKELAGIVQALEQVVRLMEAEDIDAGPILSVDTLSAPLGGNPME